MEKKNERNAMKSSKNRNGMEMGMKKKNEMNEKKSMKNV
jgi:hypothetical protein